MSIASFDMTLVRLAFVSVLGVSGLAGCGTGEYYAPVSGLVTLNGEPLGDAKLIFEPIGDDDGNGFGKPSYGRTDLNGRYTLECPIAQREGAAVGKHRVRIVTLSAGGYTEEQIESARKKLLAEEKAGGGSPDNVTEESIREYLSDTVQLSQKGDAACSLQLSDRTQLYGAPQRLRTSRFRPQDAVDENAIAERAAGLVPVLAPVAE